MRVAQISVALILSSPAWSAAIPDFGSPSAVWPATGSTLPTNGKLLIETSPFPADVQVTVKGELGSTEVTTTPLPCHPLLQSFRRCQQQLDLDGLLIEGEAVSIVVAGLEGALSYVVDSGRDTEPP